MKEITLHPIGIINTPYKSLENMPIQPGGVSAVKGTIVLDKKYQEGLDDLSGFSHVILLYFFHGSTGFSLKVVPFLDDRARGLFSTRAPKRPNPIGLSVVKLIRISENILTIENVDVLDGTPLLDIKPFVPDFDQPENPRIGWLEGAKKSVKKTLSDTRFKS